MSNSFEEIDLYAVLEISKGTGKEQIKKAYRKLALTHHPDKVAEEDRATADVKFKAISQAYEILYDDDKRGAYDTHGMAAFESGRGGMGAGGAGMEDILSQMFGMGGGGPPGFGGGGGRRTRKGKDEEQEYEVTLEELYKGKTVKFSSTKNVLCGHCKGKGGKENAKAKACETCHGAGARNVLRSVAPGFVTQSTVICDSCQGNGSIFKDKDKCKKCRGKKIISERKALEIYIPRGAKEGDRIVLEGEADQAPDQDPGDIVFVLSETEHKIFKRQGVDLSADLHITLAEALCGFSRVVIKHLDGRGLHIDHPQGSILKPNQFIKIAGEGMPLKKSDAKGNLFLIVKIKFPDDAWAQNETLVTKIEKLLPKPEPPINADTVDEVDYDEDGDIDEFDGSGPGGAWVDDEDDEHAQHTQCTQQ